MLDKSSNYPIFFTAPILWYFWYTFYNHLINERYMSAVDRVDFFIHEFGHIFFSFFWNEFLTIAGWTLLQLIIPILLLIMFFRQKDYFAIALSFGWIWTNFFYIAMYSSDAIKLNLPLVNMWFWSEIVHDWNYMFHELWVILYTDLISDIFYYTAVTFFIICFAYSFILIVNRFREWKI